MIFFRRAPAFAAVALALSLAAPATATTADEPIAYTQALGARIDAALARATATGPGGATVAGGAPGVSVALVEHGTLVYARAAGVSDVATNTATSPATRFRAGSVAKMFTAVAILQLVERGRMKIDDTLASYLPDAPHAKDVTIRQLLTHTSGIANYADAAIASGAAASPTTPERILATIAAKPLDFPPGRRYGYSNTNYVLLGLVVEKVSGEPLARYEREQILSPAGMTETTFGRAAPGIPVAVGYSDPKNSPAPAVDASWLYAAGDLLTTASDLGRFDIALMDDKLVSAATLASMSASGVEAGASGRSYGLGITLRPFGTAQLIGHHGGLPGFEASDEMLPGKDFAVVVLGNSYLFDTSRVENAVLAEFVPSDYALYAAAQQRSANAVAASVDPKIAAFLRKLVSGLQRGTLDRSGLSAAMNAALTETTVSTLRGQLAPLGAMTAVAFRGKSIDGPYDVYEFDVTFATGSTTIPIRLVFDAGGKLEGFLQA